MNSNMIPNGKEGEFSNQIIRASAGTGKTFALSNRYLRLLVSGVESQSILATTFTKKGAGEILDRIVGRLSDAALDERAAATLSQELQWNLTQARAADVLHDLLRNLHRLEVSTLDSFFNRVAKVFSLELGLPPTWDIVDEQRMNGLYDQAIQSVLRDESVISLLHMISKGDAARRVASLVSDTVQNVYSIFRESGPEPWDQLPQTGRFLADDQLNVLVTQIENMELPNKSLIKHWDAVKPLALNGEWVEFACTTSFQNVLAGNHTYSRAKLPPEIVGLYQQLLPHCIAAVETRLIQQNHSTRDLLISFGEILEELKDTTGELRFDDITQRLQTFISMWDTDRFSFRLDHQIQHLLLDEFQDTAIPQWNVIRPFARNVTHSQDSKRSFFCVGDLKQAIFGWRGGVAEIFDLVDEELDNLEETATLTMSYRSAQPVIDMVNTVFLNLDKYGCNDPLSETAIQQWGSWFSEHSTTRNELKGYVSIEMAAEETRSRDDESSSGATANEKLVEKTIERIQQLSQTLPSEKNIGLIVRTNDEVGQLIFQLQRLGIPASEEGGNPITDSAAVELVLSALTLADHPGDSMARFHLSHSPLAESLGLEPETDANGHVNSAAANVAAADLRQRLVNNGYGPTVESLARLLMEKCTQRELVRLQQLVRVAYAVSTDNAQWQLRPKRFVDYVRDEVKIADQSSAQVRVMTIHKAKGLEFDVVVLPFPTSGSGWAGGTPNVVIGRDGPTAPIKMASRYAGEKVRKLLPQSFQTMVEEDRRRNVREAMCVLYVALTRAAHATHVIVTHGAKPDHKSSAGLLLSTLCPKVERVEGVLYEQGDPNWYRAEGTSPQPAPVPVKTKPLNLDEFYLPTGSQSKKGTISQEVRSGRGLPTTSPSSLEGGHQLRLNQIFQSPDGKSAKERGTLIHACFELVQWLDQSVPTHAQLQSHLKSLASSNDDVSPIIESFYQMIDREQVRCLLTRDSYQEMYMLQFPESGSILVEANRLEVEQERSFAVQLESGLLQGVIDRLVLVYEGEQLVAADVIDFKTDTIGKSELQEKIEYYKPQLAGYRRAVAKFASLPLEKVSTRMVFVETGQLVNLDFLEVASTADSAMELSNPKKKSRKKPPVKTAVRKSSAFRGKQRKLWPDD